MLVRNISYCKPLLKWIFFFLTIWAIGNVYAELSETLTFQSNTEQVEELQPAQYSISYQGAAALLARSQAPEKFSAWFQSCESSYNNLESTRFQKSNTKYFDELPQLIAMLKTTTSTLISPEDHA